jgi:hypothetical protein
VACDHHLGLRHSRRTPEKSPGGASTAYRFSGMGGERKIRWNVNSPIYQSKVLGEFPDLSDDKLILPKWIEERNIERNRRPVLSWDIARFGDDETVGMRREGGWIRLYRAHHKADTMTTTGIAPRHIGTSCCGLASSRSRRCATGPRCSRPKLEGDRRVRRVSGRPAWQPCQAHPHPHRVPSFPRRDRAA